jgi:hemoglobin/transferrin/lactoferrin receptor protein
MKNCFLGLFCLTMSFGMAQTLIIYDKSNLQGIEKVQLYNNAQPESVFLSDGNGEIEISKLNKSGSLSLRHPFYLRQSLTFEQLKESNFSVGMIEKMNDLDEVVISASRFEEKKKDVVQKIQVIRSSDLKQMNQTSTSDMLSQSGNVFVQKSQQGGGSPVIRGFETNRVLLVVDGVRMNNAIYRAGHLQNVMTIDNSILDRVEVAFGPSAVVYGSDAMGGVMHFYTKDPTLSSTDDPLVKSNAYARYFSAANGYAAHGDVSIANRRFGSLTAFTVSQFGDLKQGANRSSKYPDFGKRPWYVERINGVDSLIQNKNQNLQVGSGYEQLDLMQKFMYQSSENVKHTLNFQYSTSNDVPRYDRLTQLNGENPKYAEWYYGPQRRLFLSYKMDLTKKTRMYDNSRLIFGYQNIEESRMDRRFKNDILNHRIEKLDIATVNLDFEKQIGRSEFRYGLEGYTNFVNSSAFAENIVLNTRTTLDTRYPDGGSQMSGLAAYATNTLEFGKTKGRWILNSGLRFSFVDLKAKFNNQTFFPFPFSSIEQQHENLTGNIGLIFNPGKGFRITGNFSTGFRAPNVDDLSKVFESIQGSVIVPNPNLKAEYSYNGELGISKSFKDKVTLSVLGYYTQLNNLIYTQKSQFNGQDSILYDGQLSQVISATNAGSAYIYGLEGGLSGNLTSYLSVFGTLNYTYGRLKTDSTDYPMDHIAPLFGRLGFTYTQKGFKAEFFSNFAGAKLLKNYNLVGEDNFNYATPEGMPAWYTCNVRLNYQFNKLLGMQVACENILDQNYRVFASNISAPGRNFIVTLRYNY